ncbi:MAG TPA: hypothetical protein VF088_20880, partial [Pyrinomonadaceae bacterium]
TTRIVGWRAAGSVKFALPRATDMGLCFRDGVKLSEQRVVDALFVVQVLTPVCSVVSNASVR